MTELPEDRVYARHDRHTGAVLLVGAGAVGGFVAEELARIGVSPLTLIDKDVLAVENLVRHPLGAEALGKPKASMLADKIRRDFPLCDARGFDVDFLQLPHGKQLNYVREADLIVAATDEFECQRRVNQVCLTAEKPAIFPAVWVDSRIRDAEVGEILWVLPGRHTPCYECAVAFRQAEADAQAARGTRIDMKFLALAAAQVMVALLDPSDYRAALLDPERTCIYVHGFTPTSHGIRATFPTQGLRSLNVHVPFPETPCPACGGQERPAPLQPSPPPVSTVNRRRVSLWATAVLAVLLLVSIGIAVLVSGSSGPTHALLRSRPNMHLDTNCAVDFAGANEGEPCNSIYSDFAIYSNYDALEGSVLVPLEPGLSDTFQGCAQTILDQINNQTVQQPPQSEVPLNTVTPGEALCDFPSEVYCSDNGNDCNDVIGLIHVVSLKATPVIKCSITFGLTVWWWYDGPH